MILFMTFMIIPVFMAGYYSVMDWRGIGIPKYVGLDNYRWLFHDEVFWKSVVNTLYYSLATVPLTMALALFLAVMLNQKLPLRGFMRASIYLPAVISTVVVGIVFTWLFQDQVGLINYILNKLGINSIRWNNDPRFAMIMLIIGTVWQRTGYNMVIYLAALQGIPAECHDSAMVDGASRWQYFWRIAFPLLKNTHTFVLITCTLYSFRSFDIVYTMTKGGPLNSTKTLVMYIYELAFGKSRFGRASAAGVVLFITIVTLTSIRFLNDRKEAER